MWFVGIDWGDTCHEVAALDEQGERGGTLRVAHSAAGLQELVRWLAALSAQSQAGEQVSSLPDPERVACVMEISSGLLVTALLDAGFPVYPVNPKTLRQRRNAAGAKTDQIDALLPARLGRSELAELRRLLPQSPLVEELRELTRDQDHLMQLQTRLVNQLTACLKAAYPVGLILFSKLQQRATLLFLQRYPTLQEAQAATLEELTAFLRAMPYFPGALAVAQRLYTRLHAAQPLVSRVTARVKARLIQALLSQLLPLLEHIYWSTSRPMTPRLRGCSPVMPTQRSLPAYRGRASGSRRDYWRAGAMTKSALPARRACRGWREPRRSRGRAASIAWRIGAPPAISPCGRRCTSSPGIRPRRMRGPRTTIGAN